MKSRAASALSPLLLAVLAALAFAPAAGAFFVADDFFLLDAVVSGGPLGVWSLRSNFLRPLASASLWLDQRLWGLAPAGFHATSVLLHLLASLVAGVAARRLVLRAGAEAEEAARAGFLAGLFFLLLPAHAEPVNWISARPDLLAALFALLALALALWAEAKGSLTGILFAAAAFGASLASKESGATWPFVVLVLFLSRPGRGRPRPFAAPLVPLVLLVVLLAYLPLRSLALGGLVRGYGTRVHLNLSPLLLGDNLLRFLGRAVVPHLGGIESLDGLARPLSADGLLRLQTWTDRFAGLVVALAALVLSLRGRGAARRLAIPCLAAFLVAALPAASLGITPRGTEGERFLYLASFFAATAVAAAVASSLGSTTRRTVAILLALGWGVALVRTNLAWREAGEASRRIVYAFPAARPAAETVLLNLPDNVRGAYVQRGFLPLALRLFGQEEGWGEVVLLATVDARDAAARATVLPAAPAVPAVPAVPGGADGAAGVLEVRLAPGGSTIRQLLPPARDKGLRPTGGDPSGYRLEGEPWRPGRRLALWTGGSLVEVPRPGDNRP